MLGKIKYHEFKVAPVNILFVYSANDFHCFLEVIQSEPLKRDKEGGAREKNVNDT